MMIEKKQKMLAVALPEQPNFMQNGISE